MTQREKAHVTRYFNRSIKAAPYWLYVVGIGLLIAASSARAELCSAYCTPGVSKACGGGCIPAARNCHKPTTTACNGTRPAGASSKIFDTPKHVDPKVK